MKFAVDRGFWMPPAKKNSAMAMRCFWIFQFYERNQARIYGKENPHFFKTPQWQICGFTLLKELKYGSKISSEKRRVAVDFG